jgi:hypothetical protein
MKHTFIYLGREVKILGSDVSIYNQDGSIDKLTLKPLQDYDSAEDFVKNYITLSIVKQ